MKHTSLFGLLAVSFFAPMSWAQETHPQQADEATIRETAKDYVKAFNQHDDGAVVAFWLPEAVYTSRVTGEQVVGRDQIAAQFKAFFESDPNVKLEVNVESIQFVSPNVAVEQGVGQLLSPDAEPDATSYSAVYVRRDGKWLLDRVTDKATAVARSNYQHLKDLEWLIGSWVDDDGRIKIVTDCSWTKNQNFITRSFSVSNGDDIELSGMQIIGWDPDAEQIRSWTFDSDGGFSEGKWSHNKDTWYVHKTGMTADGKTTSAVNHIQVADDDTFEFQSTQRTLDGRPLPNIDEVVVVRR
jgi:uncharacterized protein (TIGR02246 family)